MKLGLHSSGIQGFPLQVFQQGRWHSWCYGIYWLYHNRAALLCTIFLIWSAVCGFQMVAQYSCVGGTRTNDALDLYFSLLILRFCQRKPIFWWSYRCENSMRCFALYVLPFWCTPWGSRCGLWGCSRTWWETSSYVLVGLWTFQDGKTCPIVFPTVPSRVSRRESDTELTSLSRSHKRLQRVWPWIVHGVANRWLRQEIR